MKTAKEVTTGKYVTYPMLPVLSVENGYFECMRGAVVMAVG